jgi:hypothetical protein
MKIPNYIDIHRKHLCEGSYIICYGVDVYYEQIVLGKRVIVDYLGASDETKNPMFQLK